LIRPLLAGFDSTPDTDAEAGFGGPLNVFELVKAMIEAGAAGIHLEDQLASEKKCGHMGGKVLIPTHHAIKHLIAARLAADICDVPTILLARTDANAANLLTSDIDERDKPFITGERTAEGLPYADDSKEPPGSDGETGRLVLSKPLD
jgi:isocitrate lyase